MDVHEFNNGLEELRLFFPTFKPTDSQRSAWYERLKGFDLEQWRLAVFRLTEDTSTRPSFSKIKSFLFDARRELKTREKSPNHIKLLKDKRLAIREPDPQPVAVEGGYAPRSEEKWALQKECMGGLLASLNSGDSGEEQRAMALKVWSENFRKLPGYKSKAEVEELRDQENWTELIKLGVVMEVSEQKEKPYYPSEFTGEEQQEPDLRDDEVIF